MTEAIKKSLRESAKARWTALILASMSIFGAYYFNYALSSIKPMLESILGWNSEDFGTYTSAYAWFNVFLFMLIFSGFILDKLGIRKTGLGATIVMFLGTALNYWAVSHTFPEGSVVHIPILGDMKTQVLLSSLGFAIFGVGTEAIGITISKAVVRWFKGKEMALAMGMQMSIARLGTMLALVISLPLAKNFGVTTPILFALIVMLIGVGSFITFSLLDIKLDKSEGVEEQEVSPEDEFKISDIKLIIGNLGFWYIAILCVLFYSAVFPFLFYATDLMINKYNVDPYWAGAIPGLLPLGTMFLTPLFGGIYDKYGKGATIMIIGSMILIFVHGILAIPALNMWWIATAMVLILGVGFSLVPSAMWPSVPKIIPEKQLGTAYAVIFWIQNIGLLFIPLILGIVLNSTNPDVSPNKIVVKTAIEKAFNETLAGQSFTDREIDKAIEKATGTAVDSVVQYTTYEPVSIEDIDTKKVENEIYTGIVQNLKNINLSGDKKEVLKAVTKAGEQSAFKTIEKERLNIRYDYFYDMLIFLALSVMSLLFAFLLKMEDKKKGYGLEMPNIEK
ncbi:MAG: MFS transporter [Bacteroidales bacterium]|nr:MFS transporter [Bacteroidales bacterium]MCF6341886.1 MFS transporter [Bacteroidales bacterium]